MKHKIGKKERIKLEAELVEVTKKLEELNKIDSEGFKPFYDDVENNKKIVDHRLYLEEIINKGFYYK